MLIPYTKIQMDKNLHIRADTIKLFYEDIGGGGLMTLDITTTFLGIIPKLQTKKEKKNLQVGLHQH